jgi:serine O-acetyltransferase
MSITSFPGLKRVEEFINLTFNLLFPPVTVASGPEVEINPDLLVRQLHELLNGLTDNKKEVAEQFSKNVNKIKRTLLKDANFILESDPAATGLLEVIAIYPGFFAIFCYRIANYLAYLSVPLLPRMITEHAHRVTGIDIHPLATIGYPFSIDHGTGIVIGETTIIGNNVKLYQGVTLGALSVAKNKASKKRHPTIEDNVILYSGCTILGGETVIGKNSIIGGNVWLTESIAPFSVVYHKSQITVRNQNDNQEPINFII